MKKNNNKCEECYKNGKIPSDIDCAKCDEVIIDGVNVAECSLYYNGKCLRLMTYKNFVEDVKCNSYCDYGAYARQEQLQRAKAENEKLKKEIDNLRRVD